MITDLHNRISELERGQAVSALRVSDTANSHAGTAPSVVIHNQSSVSQSVSQPATTTVSVGSQFIHSYAHTRMLSLNFLDCPIKRRIRDIAVFVCQK